LAKYPQVTALSQNRVNFNAIAKDKGVVGTRAASWTRGKDPASCADSPAVQWVPDPTGGSLKNAQFLLGDFANFAVFAKELIGEQAQTGGR
jgi:hypothetical protein